MYTFSLLEVIAFMLLFAGGYLIGWQTGYENGKEDYWDGWEGPDE